MIHFFELMYSGDFFSIVIIFSAVYLFISILLLVVKKPLNSVFSLAIPLTLVSWFTLNITPIPGVLQHNLIMRLELQAKDGVGSNAFVNSILMPCHENKGYLRGHDYKNAIYAYGRDMQNHLDKTEVFKVKPNDNLNIDKNLTLCVFAERFNTFKFQKIHQNEVQ